MKGMRKKLTTGEGNEGDKEKKKEEQKVDDGDKETKNKS